MTASGDEIRIRDYISVVVQLDKKRISHDFVVVDKLVVPVILGVDISQGNGLTLDFSSTPLKVGSHNCQAARPAFPWRQGRQRYHSRSILNKITKIVCPH